MTKRTRLLQESVFRSSQGPVVDVKGRELRVSDTMDTRSRTFVDTVYKTGCNVKRSPPVQERVPTFVFGPSNEQSTQKEKKKKILP